MSHPTPAQATLILERGVWTVPGRRDGHTALALVTSTGEYIGPIAIGPGVDRAGAEKALEGVLDVIDPLRRLALLPRT